MKYMQTTHLKAKRTIANYTCVDFEIYDFTPMRGEVDGRCFSIAFMRLIPHLLSQNSKVRRNPKPQIPT